MDAGARQSKGPERRGRVRLVLGTLAALFGIGAGLAAGVGGYVFVYAEGASYLTDVPEACANCHVMSDHLDAWVKSSHKAVAVCNDCHAPRGLLGKYTVKAINGYNHSLAFVSGDFKDPFQITPMNRRVTEKACRVCHADIVEAIDHPWAAQAAEQAAGEEPLSCVRCHAYVGHRVQ